VRGLGAGGAWGIGTESFKGLEGVRQRGQSAEVHLSRRRQKASCMAWLQQAQVASCWAGTVGQLLLDDTGGRWLLPSFS
jgi:hypothetical protein